MPQKLWVQHNTAGKIFGPTKVSIEGCSDVDDFLKEIKKEFEISGPSSHLTLYQSDGTTVIDVEVNPSLLAEGKARKNPLVVKTVVSSSQVQPIDLGLHSLTTVDLHIYAARATKKFENINVEIQSGKINVESLLKEYRWKRLYFLEFKTLLQYDKDGWSLNNAFIGGNVYKLRHEIDDGYDESIGFSDAKIERVEKHFNLRIPQSFLPEEEYPQVDIPNSLFEQLVLLRKRNSLFSETARRTLISLFLANAIEYADGEEKLLVEEEMSFSCVLEESGKRIKYNGPVDFAIGHSPVDTRLNQDCALLVVEAKTVAKLGEALGQALAQAATNFIIRKLEGRGVNGHLKVYWCISDGESWRFGYITEGKGAKLDVQQANTTTCWFHQRHMTPMKEECSKLFSLIVFWVKKAMESSRTTSRRNSGNVDEFDLDNLNIEFASASIE
ncbi:hypothetical protein BC833DRAFT_568188 [Globomyces pollinis-pini]|nr:hypothetical protein BC833DRAFT_568188 [Globomyces pollinis-pini]